MVPVSPGLRALAVSLAASAAAIPAPHALAQVGDFRVLPYQQQPALDGMLFTWFTTSDTPGSIPITRPGLKSPRVIVSEPVPVPAPHGQVSAELSAGGEFPFVTTVIFSSPACPTATCGTSCRCPVSSPIPSTPSR